MPAPLNPNEKSVTLTLKIPESDRDRLRAAAAAYAEEVRRMGLPFRANDSDYVRALLLKDFAARGLMPGSASVEAPAGEPAPDARRAAKTPASSPAPKPAPKPVTPEGALRLLEKVLGSGMRQVEVAERLGMSQSQLSDVKTQRRPWPAARLEEDAAKLRQLLKDAGHGGE